MSARLTIVLDDEELYRRLKVKAAEDGVPMKDLVERGIRMVVGQAAKNTRRPAEFDWGAYEAMLNRLQTADARAGIALETLPHDLSDIKKHLYGTHGGGGLIAAEERVDYNAK
ncbi:MAG TPA: hypothetical protein PKD27_14635 [Tepidiformaceae bacterium]|nr:hypothetical protein [Tepidiformaceae bacterium]